MADEVFDPHSKLTKSAFDSMAADARYYLWVMGDVPQDWYSDEDWQNYGKERTYTPSPVKPEVPVTTKREPVVWRPKYTPQRGAYSPYEPFDATYNTLLKVEDAIRANNPALAQTQRLITK